MSPSVLSSGRRPAPPGGAVPWPERLLRLWLEGTDELVAVFDGTHRLLAVSASLARLAGRPPEALAGLGLVDAGLFGDAAPRVLAALAGDAEAADGCEVTWAAADGRERIYRLSVHAAAGAPAAEGLSLLCARDVTEAQRAEGRLRRREHDFRTLAENSPDVIIRYGLDLRAIYCNREIEERVAITAQHIVGRTPLETSPPGLRGLEAYQRQLQHTLDTGEGGHAELLVPHPSGELRVHAVVIAPEFDAQGAVCGAIAVGRDVTEQVRVRQALARKEREFRTLAENADDHIVRWDHDARVVYANPVMVRAFEGASGAASCASSASSARACGSCTRSATCPSATRTARSSACSASGATSPTRSSSSSASSGWCAPTRSPGWPTARRCSSACPGCWRWRAATAARWG